MEIKLQTYMAQVTMWFQKHPNFFPKLKNKDNMLRQLYIRYSVNTGWMKEQMNKEMNKHTGNKQTTFQVR